SRRSDAGRLAGEELRLARPVSMLRPLPRREAVSRARLRRSPPCLRVIRRPLRLVNTVERYAPQIGGAERVVQRVSEGLAARGHDVIVVTTGRRSTEVLN